MSDPVRYEVVRGVAWLTIDRPEARNALSQAVREGLFAGVRRFNADEPDPSAVQPGRGQGGPELGRQRRGRVPQSAHVRAGRQQQPGRAWHHPAGAGREGPGRVGAGPEPVR